MRYHKRGCSDGWFQNHEYFKSEPNAALFVSLDKLFPPQPSDLPTSGEKIDDGELYAVSNHPREKFRSKSSNLRELQSRSEVCM